MHMQPTTMGPPIERGADRRQVTAAALRRIPFFREVPEDILAPLAAVSVRQALGHGASLWEPDDARGSIYVIVRGHLRVYRRSPASREATLAILREGDAFRFLARDADGRPMSEAMALDRGTLVYRFPAAGLLPVLAAHPPALASLVATMERMLAALCDLLEETILYDVETRVAHLLVRLAAESPGYPIAMTHRELAWRVETRREEVTRLLRKFACAGLIATHPHHNGIVVRDSVGLLQR